MKTTAILVLLLLAIGATASTDLASGSSADNVAYLNATNPTLMIPEPANIMPYNGTLNLINDTGLSANTTIETATSATTTTTEIPINASINETIIPIDLAAPENLSNTTAPATVPYITTNTAAPTTTITPVCGNMYQEVGEECDTTASPCGAGRWECIDCKCNRLPDETTTTTITTTTIISTEFTLPDIGNVSTIENIIPKGDNLFYLAVGAMSVILIGLIVAYVLGKEKENTTQETKLKWK